MSSLQSEGPFETYRTQLEALVGASDSKDKSRAEKWRNICEWYQDDGGRDLYCQAFVHETGISLNPETEAHQRMGAALPKNWNDYDKKEKTDAYYRAIGELFIEEMDVIVYSVPRECERPELMLRYENIVRYVRHVLLDSHLLFEDWAAYRADTPGVFGIGKSLFSHPVEVFHGARQIIYGHGTFGLSFLDNHSDLSIATIRQAIEIRLRQAFGIFGKKSLKDGSIQPVALSVLLKALAAEQVSMPLPIQHLRRINHWANHHMHSGMRHYSWMPPRVLAYLRPFLLGVGKIDGRSTVNNGIRLTRASFDAIRDGIKRKVETETTNEDPSGFELVLAETKYCTIVFKPEGQS